MEELRRLEGTGKRTAPAKSYLIAAAPQCPYPDANLGPDAAEPTSALQGRLWKTVAMRNVV